MYITFADYLQLYPEIDERTFKLLVYDACRYIDRLTTGIDGVRKLKVAFPADEDSAEAVKRCAGKLVNTLCQIQDAEKAIASGRGYTETERGLQRKIISRVEAGNEAISYMEPNIGSAAIDKAVADSTARELLISGIVREFLSGITDANGVNLLYMGTYPL